MQSHVKILIKSHMHVCIKEHIVVYKCIGYRCYLVSRDTERLLLTFGCRSHEPSALRQTLG